MVFRRGENVQGGKIQDICTLAWRVQRLRDGCTHGPFDVSFFDMPALFFHTTRLVA